MEPEPPIVGRKSRSRSSSKSSSKRSPRRRPRARCTRRRALSHEPYPHRGCQICLTRPSLAARRCSRFACVRRWRRRLGLARRAARKRRWSDGTVSRTTPGPVKYTLPSQLGKQPDGRKKDPPIYSMGKADRFKLTGKLDPRPDFHEVAPIIGNKGNLIGAAEPRYGFGTASREQAGKVMEPYPGGDSPGPYIALPKSIGGKQPDGRKKDPPNWTLREGTAPALVSMGRMRRPLAGTRRVQSTMRREALARFRTQAFGRCRRIRCRAMQGRPWRLVGIRRGRFTICPPPWTSRSRRTGGRRRHDRRPRRPSQSSRGGRILRRRRRRTRFQGRGRMAERMCCDLYVGLYVKGYRASPILMTSFCPPTCRRNRAFAF